MEKKVIEKNILIARRIPSGDRWKLEIEEGKEKIYGSLTEALEAYVVLTGFRGEYRLAPMKSELYIIQSEEQEIKSIPEKKYSIYDEH
jgi:hypothetical protein